MSRERIVGGANVKVIREKCRTPYTDRLLRLDDVEEITTLGRTEIHDREKAGKFPERRELGVRRLVWIESEVLAWLHNLPQPKAGECRPAGSFPAPLSSAIFRQGAARAREGCAADGGGVGRLAKGRNALDALKQELKERMETFAVRARAIVGLCDNEEQTKVSLINPYLEMLGYDVRDPRYVRLEVRADIHAGNEKVDYAILRQGKPWMVVEAKKASVLLGTGTPTKQIQRYAMATDMQYVAYTNGRHWRWFRKSAGTAMLEERPFLEHDVTEPEDREIRWLAGIHASAWNAEEVARIADEERLQSDFGDWYRRCRENPSGAFLKLLLNAHGYRATPNMMERARAAWKATLKETEAAQLNEASRRLRGGTREEEEEAKETPENEPAASQDELKSTSGEIDGPRRRWKFRWRTRSEEPWQYEQSGRHAQIAIGNALFSTGSSEAQSDIVKRLNSPVDGDDLRRETAQLLETGTAAPRYFEAMNSRPDIAIYVNLSSREQVLWFYRAKQAAPSLEVETEQGQRDPRAEQEEWPWTTIDDLRATRER